MLVFHQGYYRAYLRAVYVTAEGSDLKDNEFLISLKGYSSAYRCAQALNHSGAHWRTLSGIPLPLLIIDPEGRRSLQSNVVAPCRLDYPNI
jgi:hypothetical protein